jgi:hypothetical protein
MNWIAQIWHGIRIMTALEIVRNFQFGSVLSFIPMKASWDRSRLTTYSGVREAINDEWDLNPECVALAISQVPLDYRLEKLEGRRHRDFDNRSKCVKYGE